jgi:hypothetical protein
MRKTRLIFLLSALLFAARAQAQTKTVVSGTITDPNGVPYSFGSVSEQLIPTGGNPSVNGAAIDGFNAAAALDANGHFTVSLWCNTAGGGCSPISPSGTQWLFQVTNQGAQPPVGFGPVSFQLAITITGATQDVSVALSNAAPLLLRPTAAGSVSFANITSGTNLAAAMVVGTGASLTVAGTGTINANRINGASVPLSAAVVGTNASGQLVSAGGSVPAAGSAGDLQFNCSGVLGNANCASVGWVNNLASSVYALRFPAASGLIVIDSLSGGNLVDLGSTGAGNFDGVILGASDDANSSIVGFSQFGSGGAGAGIFFDRLTIGGTDNHGGDFFANVPGILTIAGATSGGCTLAANATSTTLTSSCTIAGGGSISGLTTNTIPKAASATSLTNSSLTDNGTTVSTSEAFITSAAGAASTPSLSLTGALFTGGSGTTTVPLLYRNATGATAPSTWSTSGTQFGINAASGFAGNFLDFHVNGGVSLFSVSNAGAVSSGGVGTNGVFDLCGSTSGCATITAPAVAGTATNPLLLSNALTIPVGAESTPTINFSGDTNSGWYWVANHQQAWAENGTASMRLNSQSELSLSSSVSLGFTNGVDAVNNTYDIGFCRTGVNAVSTNTTAGTCTPGGSFQTAAYLTATNCANSGGTCGSAAAGHVSIAASATTVTVSTTAVTANSEIEITEDSTVGSLLSVTCNTTVARTYAVSTRTAGTSFVITASAAPVTNPACLGYTIKN